jgi:hypothetical protein
LDEFPSAWHRQAHIDALERELEGCRRRAAEAEDLMKSCQQGEQIVVAELARLRPKTPAKPPAKKKVT